MCLNIFDKSHSYLVTLLYFMNDIEKDFHNLRVLALQLLIFEFRVVIRICVQPQGAKPASGTNCMIPYIKKGV